MPSATNKAKVADGCAGGRGHSYEFRKCMLCVVRGYTRERTEFQLRYQVPESVIGKFDDVVFDEGGGIYQVFQLKHMEKGEQVKISSSQLFHEKLTANFSLLKYVKSLIDVTLEGTVRMAVVFTNVNFEFKEGDEFEQSNEMNLVSNQKPCYKDWYEEIPSHIQLRPFTLDANAIFDTSTSYGNAKYYKFDNDQNIIHILKRQSVWFLKELREKLNKQEKTKTKKKDEPRSSENKKFEDQLKDLREANEALARDLENLTEDKIWEALQLIVYAVGQPNDTELGELIKTEIRDYFQLQNVDTVYNALEIAITNWCNTKVPFVEQMDDPQLIQFKDADRFFQKNVKNISYGIIAPTSSFTGRLNELKLIKEKLEEKHDLIVSQNVAINGLGGIGKTELTKQFIKVHGQTDFYGRVIWIEAESDESVKKCFKGLGEKVDIQNIENKSITTIIDQIFDFFHGVKVLFVFDNFDKSFEYLDSEETDINAAGVIKSEDNKEKNLVIYCRKRARDSTKKHRPYFIFTSRNRECLPGVITLDLNVLTKEDASELIKKGLTAIKYTDQDVEELAKVLQYFPLALQQAIAYIKNQNEIKKAVGGGYTIQNYLKEFALKTKELLNYRYKNDFDEFGQTTLVTWNVTFDAIKKDKTNGANAIKIIQFMSYLYADKIDANIFLSLFNNNLDRTGAAILLLKKYSLISKIGETTFYQIHRLVQTVVQLNFRYEEGDILYQAWELIFPELYKKYFNQKDTILAIAKYMAQCTVDQFLHYNNLSFYFKTYRGLNSKFLTFFQDLRDRVVLEGISKDDINKIKEFQLTHEELKAFAKSNISQLCSYKLRKLTKYFIENGYLDLNDFDFKLIAADYLDMFKYLVEKGAKLNNLKLVSIEVIDDIMHGNTEKLLGAIEREETENKVEIMKEALFFASLFNHESIVQLLITKKVEPDYKFCDRIDCAPIRAAIYLEYPNVLKLLLNNFKKPCDKEKVAQIINDLLMDKHFFGQICFEIIFKKYIELGGDINDELDPYKSELKSTFLALATSDSFFDVGKINIVNFLLDNGADPLLEGTFDGYALYNVFISINKHLDNPNDKDLFKEVFRKIRSKISNEDFMTRMSKILFDLIKHGKIHEITDMLFEENDDINFRNDKGETLLINFVLSPKTNLNEMEHPEATVYMLLEAGVDVYAKDMHGKDVFHYAVVSESLSVFKFLLTKFSSVNEEVLKDAIEVDNATGVEELLKTHFKFNHIFEDRKTIIEVVLENLSLNTIFLLDPVITDLKYENEVERRIAEKAQMALDNYISRTSWLRVDSRAVDIFVKLGADSVSKMSLLKETCSVV